MFDHTEVTEGNAIMPEDWMLLKDGAAKVADQRLSDLHQLLTGTVSGFHRDAVTQIESIHGESHEGLGSELFKAAHSVMMVCFPEEAVLEKALAEVVKGARDVALTSIAQSEAASASGRLEHAKEELRRKLDDLTTAADDGFRAGWQEAVRRTPDALTAFFEDHPEYKETQYGENANEWEGWLCDQMGIHGAFEAYSVDILRALWHGFTKDFTQTTAHLHFFEMDNDTERLLFLLQHVESVSNVNEFLTLVGADVAYWDRLLRLYHAQYGNEVTDVNAWQLVQYAMLHPEE
jgi:hypothetical protein